MLGGEIRYIMNDKTVMFPLSEDKEVNIRQTLHAVYQALAEKGYNPISQMVGYILSGDPTYVTNHRNARGSMIRLDRDDLLQVLLKFYLSN